MKNSVLTILIILFLGVVFAGCTGIQSPPVATPAQTAPVSPSATMTPTQQPSFRLGDHYLQKSYSFSGVNETIAEQFYVNDPAWGIRLEVMPLNDDPRLCWLVMTITNVNTGSTDSYGYGGGFPFEPDQMIPMYMTGPYKIELKGDRVKIDVTAAKRYP